MNFIMFHIKSNICFAFALCDGFPNVLLETLKSLQADFHIVVNREQSLPRGHKNLYNEI